MTQQFPLIKTTCTRHGRCTAAQQAAMQRLWHSYVWREDAVVDSPVVLDIGCGRGDQTIAAAQRHPQLLFVAVDVYRPGLGWLLQGLEQQQLHNVRVYAGDVRQLLAPWAPQSLFGIQIFFPDPWRKHRHHKRRLVQAPFIAMLLNALRPQGFLHLATDWPDYAQSMAAVLQSHAALRRCARLAELPVQRYVTTAFERKAQQQGRAVFELAFIKQTDQFGRNQAVISSSKA